MNIPKPVFLAALVILNAVPIYGVLYWGWRSFDLIFLYWLENLVIGLFVITRFVVRRYQYPVELVLPLFMAPFFAFHYGGFCWGHGTFIISLFGKDTLGATANLGIPDVIMPTIKSRHLLVPVLALFTYQLIDWIRDIKNRGLGNDNVFLLMTAPYRRIMVLHLTIIASGFALVAMKEPVAGLLLLVAVKTGNDIYHWFKDEKLVTPVIGKLAPAVTGTAAIDPWVLRRVDAFIANPTITVNGQETKRFNSIAELKAWKYYGMVRGALRMAGVGNQIKQIEEYADQKLKEKALSR